MLIRFNKHGAGSAVRAADYLLQELDWKGEEREDIEVLRGDPREVADVADALEFKYTYTSGVIAWAVEDQPTDEQIERTVDEFEKLAWAGMEPHRYAWTAVKHRDSEGKVHVHVVAARCDLETGKSLNIAPPNWERTYGALQNYLNQEYGWADPKDRERKRLVQPSYRAYFGAASRVLRAMEGNEDREAQELARATIVLGSAARAGLRDHQPPTRIEKALARGKNIEDNDPPTHHHQVCDGSHRKRQRHRSGLHG